MYVVVFFYWTRLFWEVFLYSVLIIYRDIIHAYIHVISHNIYSIYNLNVFLLLCWCPLGSYPKTKPPPLLSLHRPPGPSLGAPASRGPLSSHIPYGAPAVLRGPLLHPTLPYHPGPRGPHGIRGAPPSLKSSRPPLLAAPGGLLIYIFSPQLCL